MIAQKETKEDPTRLIHPRRPFVLRVLFWVFSFWALLGWLRFARALMDRSLILEALGSNFDYYFLFAGLFSGLGALPVLWGLLRGKPWTLKLVWAMAVFYPALYWFERLALWADPNIEGNWPFMVLLTLLWFGLVAWASSSKRSRSVFKADKKGNEK